MKPSYIGLWVGLSLLAMTSGLLAQGWNEGQSEGRNTAGEQGAGGSVQAPAEPSTGRRGGRGGPRNMSEEERAAWRERWNNMSEEERAAMRERRSRGERRGDGEERGGGGVGEAAPVEAPAASGEGPAEDPAMATPSARASDGTVMPESTGRRGSARMGGGQRGSRGGSGRQSGSSRGGGGMRGTRPAGDALRAVNVPDQYQSLVTNSPFMSAEYRASLLSSISAGRRELMFTGLSRPGGQWLFGLEERRQDRTYWMAEGENDNGIEILQFDETEQTLSVSIDGREFILRFRTQ